MLHHNPQHVLSSTLLIFRRTNCIITTSGIVTLCKQPYSICRLRADCRLLSTGILYCTESDDTRGCNNTICPPEDEQGTAHSFTLFSVYPYTGENQGCGNCHSCSYKN